MTKDKGQRNGLTLIELLVVILIISLVSVVALGSGALTAFNHREVSEAGRILQGALVGARDKAIHDGQPCGIRLLPDPTYPLTWVNTGAVAIIKPSTILAYNRIVPIDSAPEYSEGFCTPVTQSTANAFTKLGVSLTNLNPAISAYPNALILIEDPVDPKTGFPNPPTSWFWNIRVGDRIQLHNAGPWYTVVGPMLDGPGSAAGNAEMFVNVGPSANETTYAAVLPNLGGKPVEYLVLVNGQDDNNNGWIDEGFDGVDNNGNGIIDDGAGSPSSEWEQEIWQGSVLTSTQLDVPYTIRRRPAPAANAREVALPTSMVIDATSAFLTQERSRLPVNPYTGFVDIVLNPDGTVLPTVVYSSPSSFNMGESFYHFWLAERQDLADVPTGLNNPPYLPIAQPGGVDAGAYTGPKLKGAYSLLTLFARTGQIVVNSTPPFDDPVAAANQNRGFNVNLPFLAPQQGLSGGP